MDKFCLFAILGLTVLIGAIVAMFLDYKAKANKKGIELERNDKQHEHKHHLNEERIKELEKKNGHEQHQIDSLKEDNMTLKKQVAELLKRTEREKTT